MSGLDGARIVNCPACRGTLWLPAGTTPGPDAGQHATGRPCPGPRS